MGLALGLVVLVGVVLGPFLYRRYKLESVFLKYLPGAGVSQQEGLLESSNLEGQLDAQDVVSDSLGPSTISQELEATLVEETDFSDLDADLDQL